MGIKGSCYTGELQNGLMSYMESDCENLYVAIFSSRFSIADVCLAAFGAFQHPGEISHIVIFSRQFVH